MILAAVLVQMGGQWPVVKEMARLVTVIDTAKVIMWSVYSPWIIKLFNIGITFPSVAHFFPLIYSFLNKHNQITPYIYMGLSNILKWVDNDYTKLQQEYQ